MILPHLSLGATSIRPSATRQVRYRFGPFTLDPAESSLSRNGNRVKMQDLPVRLLLMLVERPGEIVIREEVRQRVWPENTFVEFDYSLGVAIRKIRDALGDNADASCYVETIPRRGYRFLTPVTTATGAEDLLRSATGEAAKPQSSSLGEGKRPLTSGRRLRYRAGSIHYSRCVGRRAFIELEQRVV